MLYLLATVGVAFFGDRCKKFDYSQSRCGKEAGCKWYGRLNDGVGGCVAQWGPNDPKANGGDRCMFFDHSQSKCSKEAGCKWYGRLNQGTGGCVTQGGPNDPKAFKAVPQFYCVRGAGSREANGKYKLVGTLRGSPHYKNNNDVSLSKYRFRFSGKYYWYLGKYLSKLHFRLQRGRRHFRYLYRTARPNASFLPPVNRRWKRHGSGRSPVPKIYKC